MTAGKYIDVVKYDKFVIHSHEGENYHLYYYNFKKFQKLLKKVFPDINKIRRYMTRGFTDGEVIYLLSKDHWYSRIHHEFLILHEIGHIKGYEHKWYIPDIMNPTWFFRWSRYRW